MANAAAFRRLEEAVLAGWPSLSTTRDESWLIRLSEGHTGRANSINFLDPEDGADPDRRLDAAIEVFRAGRIPPLARVTPLTPKSVIAVLDKRSWSRLRPSLVMTLDIAGLHGDGPSPEARPSHIWLGAMQRFMGFTDAKRDAIARKLAHLDADAGFFLATDDTHEPVATTLAVRLGETVGLYEVGVDPAKRRRGHAENILRDALAWGRHSGATTATLQVQADNAAAVALYRRLGFTEAYGYVYRSPPAAGDQR